MDPHNPVVQLCALGMEAEANGDLETAVSLFLEAWVMRRNDYEACIAAHYVARHQDSETDRYKWNAEALRCAEAVDEERVRPLYPSLYLNMGHSCEMTGKPIEARHFYEAAERCLSDLERGSYREMVAAGVARALARVNPDDPHCQNTLAT